MPNLETQREIERLQGELQKAQNDLVIVNEKLAGRRNSANWEQRSGQENWKRRLEEETIPHLKAEIVRLQATESQTESGLEEQEEELNKWFETIPNLDKEEDADFVLWMTKERSKGIDNYKEPVWVKEQIENGTINLDQLKQEFRDWEVGEELKRERERERETK